MELTAEKGLRHAIANPPLLVYKLCATRHFGCGICNCCGRHTARAQVTYEDHKLMASDGEAFDWFGLTISAGGGMVVVGAPFDDDHGNLSGAAYLFDASTGTQTMKLLPDVYGGQIRFGSSVAIESGTVAIGARYYSKDSFLDHFAGAAYLFDVATGFQIAKFFPDYGSRNAQFGVSIALGDGLVAVGAYSDTDNGEKSGSAYVFDASTGEKETKLLPSDGGVWDYFGVSIDIDNGVVVVGSYWDDDNGKNSGSAYLFDALTGTQLAKLLPDDGAQWDEFGISVAIDNGVVAVGSRYADAHGQYSGSVYLFDALTGAQTAKLIATDTTAGDQFGRSVAIDNGLVAVGAWQDGDNAYWSGSAYVFDLSTGVQLAKLLPSDGAELDRFGLSIALDNGMVAVGSPFDDDSGTDSGSAYVFDLGGVLCPADLTGDGSIDSDDLVLFIDLYLAGDPLVDLTRDGIVDAGELGAFITAYLAGC